MSAKINDSLRTCTDGREKDVLYYELLEALQAGGCPLCRLGRRAADSYLDALIYEGVTDVRSRDELREARGPCYRHAWRMAGQRGSVLGTAIIYRDVINTLTKALEQGATTPSRWRGGGKPALARALAATTGCPACRLEADAAQRTAKTLLKHLDQPEIAEAYVAAGGVCLPHFQLVLSHAGEGAARTLANWQAAACRRLRSELDELIRKHDHRFRSEPVTEREADAWERAVAAAVGAKEETSR